LWLRVVAVVVLDMAAVLALADLEPELGYL
jgi:hypothetical protein